MEPTIRFLLKPIFSSISMKINALHMAIEATGKNIFKTQTGLRLLRDMYAQNAYHELTKGGRKSEH